jgi:hypothetical protein
MTKVDPKSAFEGDTITPIERPKTRQQKIDEYRAAHQAEYKRACENERCTCTPTRAEMLIMENYNHPPID